MFPHQQDIINWCIEGGRRAIFASFGLGKTVMQLVKEFFKSWGIKKDFKLLKSNQFKEAKLLVLDSKKANKELRWKSRLTFKETLSLTVEWYKNYLLKKNLEKLTISQINYYLKK